MKATIGQNHPHADSQTRSMGFAGDYAQHTNGPTSIYLSVQSAPGIFVHDYVQWDFMCSLKKMEKSPRFCLAGKCRQMSKQPLIL